MEFLRTERLILRSIEARDAERLAQYRSDPEVARYVPWVFPYPIEKAHEVIGRMADRSFENVGDGLFIVVERALDGVTVGEGMVRFENGDERQVVIGYAFARECQGAGYATEVARALLAEFLGRRGKHRATAMCDAQNVGSRRVLEKVGMRLEAVMIEAVHGRTGWVDECLYAMLGREWRAATPS